MKREWQLDYLKTFAIIMVIITHIFSYNEVAPLPGIFPYLVEMAVPVFMIISGYVNTISFTKKTAEELKAGNWKNYFCSKLYVIYLPFTVLYFLEIILMYIIQKRTIGLHEAIYVFLTGGWGPGSYYIPMLTQFIFCFPILYYLVKKDSVKGSIVILGTQILFEILVAAIPVPEALYRLILIRYLAFIWFGIIVFYYRRRIKNTYVFIMALIGSLYIALIPIAHQPMPVFRYWTSTSMPTVFWAGALVMAGMYFPKRFPGIIDKVMNRTGTSTYCIFLIQMAYFQLGFGKISNSFLFNFILGIVINCLLGIFMNDVVSLMLKNVGRERRSHERT